MLCYSMAKFNLIKAIETRDKKLARANKLNLQAMKLEEEAENIDLDISEHCTHPKQYLKLKRFSDAIPQKTMWLCTACYQSVDHDPGAKEQMLEDTIKFLFDTWDEIESPRINPKKK